MKLWLIFSLFFVSQAAVASDSKAAFYEQDFLADMFITMFKSTLAPGQILDVDTRNKNGLTALMFACNNNLPEIAGSLIDRKADVDAETDDDFLRTAHTFARMGGCHEISERLWHSVRDEEFWRFSLSPLLPVRVPVVQSLQENGYFCSKHMPFPRHIDDELMSIFNGCTIVLDDSRRLGGPHAEATCKSWAMDFSVGRDYYSSNYDVIPVGIRNLVLEVGAYLPEGDYFAKVDLFDDVAKWARRARIDEELRLPELYWHQDKFSEYQSLNFEWLYFRVIEAIGLDPKTNKLGIGTLADSDMELKPCFGYLPKDSAEGKVNQLASIDGRSGAGYMIHQNYIDPDGSVILHNRSEITATMPESGEIPTRKIVVVRVRKRQLF